MKTLTHNQIVLETKASLIMTAIQSIQYVTDGNCMKKDLLEI